MSRRHYFSLVLPDLCSYNISVAFSLIALEPCRKKVWYRYPIYAWSNTHLFLHWLLVCFWINYRLLCKGTSLTRLESHTNLWVDVNLDGSLILWPFGKIIVIGSPSRPMCSTVINSWLDLSVRDAFPSGERALKSNQKAIGHSHNFHATITPRGLSR